MGHPSDSKGKQMKTTFYISIIIGCTFFLFNTIIHVNIIDTKHHNAIMETITQSNYPCQSVNWAIIHGYDHFKVKCSGTTTEYNVYGKKTFTVMPSKKTSYIINIFG